MPAHHESTTPKAVAPARTIRPKLRPRRWSLAFCCNDHRNGHFAGRVDSIRFGAGRGNFDFGTDWCDEHSLSLNGPAVSFEWRQQGDGQEWFHLGPHLCLCEGVKEWVGNWCWDACFVSANVLREICPWLKAQGWSPEEGSELLWGWWDGRCFAEPPWGCPCDGHDEYDEDEEADDWWDEYEDDEDDPDWDDE